MFKNKKTINVEFTIKEFKQLMFVKSGLSWHDFILESTGLRNKDETQPVNNSDYFWNRVDKKGDDDCWNWLGKVSYNKYSMVRTHPIGLKINKSIITAHKAAYLLSKGEIPKGLYVLHRCDNKNCCNPKHLFLGTPYDNTHDMMNKGRCSGNTNTTLSQVDIELILKLLNDGKSKLLICEIFKDNGKALSIKQIDNLL